MIRIVAYRDEYIHVLRDGIRSDFEILKNLPTNLKMHVFEKSQPLQLKIHYENASIARSVRFYCSFSCKEPDEDNYDVKRVITESNTTVQVLDLHDKHAELSKFQHQWLYITLMWDQDDI